MNGSKRSAWLVRGVVLLAGVAALALLVVSSGIVSVKASSRHWAITNWFLHYTMRRSVSTQSLFEDVPSMKAPWLVLKGAGHFETGCRPCHGAPDLAPPLIPHAMTPFPPDLSSSLSGWSTRELFYVVKHGIKFTAMPAWATQKRDDEVAAVVAFLKELPALNAQTYQQLVHGVQSGQQPSAPVAELVAHEAGPLRAVASCGRCHGEHGEGRGSAAFPKLAQQKLEYQYQALAAYAQGKRHSGIMQPIAAGLSDAEKRSLSAYYARQPVPSTGSLASASRDGRRSRGEKIATVGIPERGVPACVECHAPSKDARNPGYPLLGGQYADYLLLQLQLFKSRQRGGSPYAHLMHHVVDRLQDAELREVAEYFAAEPPRRDP